MSKYWLITIITFFVLSEVVAQVVENYSGEFQYETVKTITSKNELISTSVNLSTFPKSSLKISIPSNTTAFVNNQIWLYATTDTLFFISLDAFKKEFGLEGQNKVSMVFYGEKIDQQRLVLEKGYFDSSSHEEDDTKKVDSGKRVKSIFKDFYFISTAIVFGIFAVIKVVFPTALSFFLSPKAIFSLGDNMEGNPKFFSFDVLFFLFFIGLGVVQVLMFFINFFSLNVSLYFNPKDLNDLFFKWILGAAFFVLLSTIKFLYISFMSYIFNLRKFELIHFFFLLRIVSVLVFATILIQLFFLTNSQIEFDQWQIFTKNIAFFIYLLGIAFLFVMMTNQLNFKFYHLIVYLCTAELLPFLVLTKHLIW